MGVVDPHELALVLPRVALAHQRRHHGNRVLRVDPPYYAAVVVSVLLHLWLARHAPPARFALKPGMFGAANIGGNFLVLWIWYGLKRLGMAPDYYYVKYVWSLVVEVKFYLMAAILYYLSTRKGSAYARYAIPAGLGAALAFHAGFRFFHISLLRDFEFAPYFALGLCLYYAVQRNRPEAMT